MKRGSFQDLFYLGVMAFAVVLFGFVLYYVFHTATGALGSALVAAGGNSNMTTALAGVDSMNGSFVNALPLGFFIAGLIAIALASFVPVHPVFMPIGIIMLLASVVFFVFVQNAASDIFGTDFFKPLALQFPMATLFTTHIATIIAVLGAIMLIVIYGRIRSQGGGGNPEG